MLKAVPFFRDNGLTIAVVAVFAACLVGMVWSGCLDQNATLVEHEQAPFSVLEFFKSASFQSALFENWESEFLQISAYVIMAVFLFQRGSSESKDPDNVVIPLLVFPRHSSAGALRRVLHAALAAKRCISQ
jgi:hypothetical protein